LYSGKHKLLHGMKVEAAVLPNSLALGVSERYPGSVSDFEVFRGASSGIKFN